MCPKSPKAAKNDSSDHSTIIHAAVPRGDRLARHSPLKHREELLPVGTAHLVHPLAGVEQAVVIPVRPDAKVRVVLVETMHEQPLSRTLRLGRIVKARMC